MTNWVRQDTGVFEQWASIFLGPDEFDGYDGESRRGIVQSESEVYFNAKFTPL